MQRYLQPNFFVDSDHPAVRAFAHSHCDLQAGARKKAIQLYYAVRDGFRYNPYEVGTRREDYQASSVAKRSFQRGGHCIDKANLLAACARVAGIPSRLHFANVRNHIGTEKLERELGSNVLVFHGYVELFISEKWVACTPAFNEALCNHLGVAPLDFDGLHDSVFQEYDKGGNKFMEYLHDYGTFDEIPFDLMMSEWKVHYPDYVTRILPKSLS